METCVSKRALRRSRTLRVSLRRRREHLRETHPAFLNDPRPENVDCVCEVAPWYYAKNSLGHRDSKKTPGRPKHGRGCCSHGSYRMSATVRNRSRRLERAILTGSIDPEWVEPPVWFWGWLERRRLPYATARPARGGED